MLGGHARVERYVIHDEPIAAGGMASVHLARLSSEGGFRKIVAVKAMHAHLSREPDFRAMFLDEARTVSPIRHTNVVSTLDILVDGDAMMLVMDYVHGPSLGAILRHVREREAFVPLPIAAKLACDLLDGLHAAHNARGESGAALEIVHRDVSPHNVLVGVDGTARVTDFGIASAADRSYVTKTGEVKGKVWYMAPEQARGERVDRRADVYAAGTVLFELLTNRTPFQGGYSDTMFKVLLEPAPLPSDLRPDVGDALDAIVLRALAKTADERFATAREMSESLRDVIAPSTAQAVSEWLTAEMPTFFEERDAFLQRVAAETGEAAEAPELDAATKTRIEVPSSSGRARRPLAIVAIAASLAIAGVGGAAFVRASRPRAPAAHESSTSASPSPSSDGAASAAAPASASSSAPGEGLRAAASASASSARGERRPGARPSARPSATPAVTPEVSSPPPKCCIQVAGVWERYSFRSDCVNNCPTGML